MTSNGRHPNGPSRPTPVDPSDLLTAEELAERLKVRRSWIFEQTRARTKARYPRRRPLPTIRMGKYVRFSWSAVSEWLLHNAD